jgi:hypothetical protein
MLAILNGIFFIRMAVIKSCKNEFVKNEVQKKIHVDILWIFSNRYFVKDLLGILEKRTNKQNRKKFKEKGNHK